MIDPIDITEERAHELKRNFIHGDINIGNTISFSSVSKIFNGIDLYTLSSTNRIKNYIPIIDNIFKLYSRCFPIRLRNATYIASVVKNNDVYKLVIVPFSAFLNKEYYIINLDNFPNKGIVNIEATKTTIKLYIVSSLTTTHSINLFTNYITTNIGAIHESTTSLTQFINQNSIKGSFDLSKSFIDTTLQPLYTKNIGIIYLYSKVTKKYIMYVRINNIVTEVDLNRTLSKRFKVLDENLNFVSPRMTGIVNSKQYIIDNIKDYART